MKTFIFTGGTILPQNITEKPAVGDLCIAADSGYDNALLMNVTADIILGDFDSISKDGRRDIDKTDEVIKVPEKKSFTDTQLAVKTAVDKGASEIVIIGGLDGRLDHALSNLAILKDLNEKRISSLITDGRNRVRYIKASSTLIAKGGFKYLSVISDGKASGVSIEGCEYPLKNAKLDDCFQYAVSNEITKNCAFISVKKGGIFIIESNDSH